MATKSVVSNLQAQPSAHRHKVPTANHSSQTPLRLAFRHQPARSSLRHILAASNGAPISTVISNPPQSIARDSSSSAEEVEDLSLPDELASLSALVKQLAEETSKSSDSEVVKLKEAFGELAEDLKKKIAETSPGPRPAAPKSSLYSPVTIRGYAGSAAVPPKTNPFSSSDLAEVESDLEGMIPSKAGVLPSSVDKQVIDRDEVSIESVSNDKDTAIFQTSRIELPRGKRWVNSEQCIWKENSTTRIQCNIAGMYVRRRTSSASLVVALANPTLGGGNALTAQ